MKKLLLSLVILLGLFGGEGWGVTCYVSPTGTNTSPYDTWINAANLPSTAVTYLNGRASSGHTLYIAPNTYNDYLLLTDGDANNLTIYATSAHATIAHATENQVVINSSGLGKHTLRTDRTIFVYGFITLTGADLNYSQLYVTAGNGIFYDTILIGGPTTLYSCSGGSPKFIRGVIKDGTNAADFASISGTASPLYAYTKFLNNVGSLKATGGSVVTISNCDFILNQREVIVSITGSQIINVNNTIFSANGYGSAMKRIFTQSGSGAININKSIVLGPPDLPTTVFSGTVNITNSITNFPKFINNKHKAIITIIADDIGNYSIFSDLVTYANSLGIPMAFAMQTGSSTPNYSGMRAQVAAGNEIISHTISHPDLTTLNSEDLSNELLASKLAIETGIGGGYTCKTVVYPGGTTNLTVQQAALAAGYIGARSVASTDSSLSSLNIFNIDAYSATDILNSTTGVMDVTSAIEGGGEIGKIVVFMLHNGSTLNTPLSDAEYIAAIKTTIIDTIAASGARVMTFADAIEHITGVRLGYLTGDTATTDNLTYTRTQADQSDYHLQPGSPAAGAGVFVPGVHDQPSPNNVDLGGQEFNSMAINIGAYGVQDTAGNPVAQPTLRGL